MLPIRIDLPAHFLEEEIRCGYTVSSEIKKVWAVQLDLLNELMRVCRENNIEIYGTGGTILGAARHKGYIPWDDDIDLMMTRENYNKLCSCAKEAFSYPYFFQTEYTDPGSARGHAQLRNSATTGVLTIELSANLPINQGIFIDIFPLDYVPDNDSELLSFAERLNRMWLNFSKLKLWLRYDELMNCHGVRGLLKKSLRPFVRFMNKVFRINDLFYMKIEKEMQKFNRKPTENLGIMPTAFMHPHRFVWSKADFAGETEWLEYEFLKIPVPKGYKNMLTKTYGKWQEFVRGGSMHGGVIFDAESPYKEYLVKSSGGKIDEL